MEHRWHLPDNDHQPTPVPPYPAAPTPMRALLEETRQPKGKVRF
jgi:hypothetical protein